MVDFAITIFSGMILPLEQYPFLLKHIAFSLPFSYMMYYPVMGILGKLDEGTLLRVIFQQIVWTIALYSFYRWLWKKGSLKFTGVGQ
jgi:ABC-2 type transport system permease protein